MELREVCGAARVRPLLFPLCLNSQFPQFLL